MVKGFNKKGGLLTRETERRILRDSTTKTRLIPSVSDDCGEYMKTLIKNNKKNVL